MILNLFLIIIFILLISVALSVILFSNSSGSVDHSKNDCPTVQQAMSGAYSGDWVLKAEFEFDPSLNSNDYNTQITGSLENVLNIQNTDIILTDNGFKILIDSGPPQQYLEYIYADGEYTAKPSMNGETIPGKKFKDGKDRTVKSATFTLKGSNCS
jgi:hypothetical protein